ncbi:MAG TPA: ferritin [Thermoanaerobaculia bacterium]|nr:ferritin [Thermoanaerobaculia bacterium]HUM30096.1 ferritin [Thermoanaerobaculia bacterium]HXK68793.1 ferritin [Thermoanaerobaculia bacterium]
MLSKKMEQALNEQINRELFSSYLYLSMAAYFEDSNLPGFASWMQVQSQEEYMHAMKFYSFIHERRGRVTLKAIEEPKPKWKSPLDAFQEAFKHEQFITGHINELANMALKDKDHATHIFLQWFITEQVEEENSADEIVQKLKMIGDSQQGLFMLNREMGFRGQAGK